MPVNISGGNALADFNGDGRPDLISQTASGFSILINDGTGKFLPGPVTYPYNTSDGNLLIFPFVVADFDQDGRMDVVAATNLGMYFYRGDGKGGLAPGRRTSIRNFSRPVSSVTADFNGDGLADIAIDVPGGGLRVYLGTGGGEFQELTGAFTDKLPSPGLPTLKAGDVNGDGKPDLISTDPLPRTMALLLNDGTGHFRASQILQRGQYSRPEQVTIGDFDHSGKPELVTHWFLVDPSSTAWFRDNYEFWKTDSSGSFSQRATIAANIQPGGLANADIDQDGNLDVVSAGSKGTTIYFGDGKGGFTESVTIDAAIGSPLLADLDGDGRPEIVLLNNRSISVLGSALIASRVLLTQDPPNPFSQGQTESFTVAVLANALVPGFPAGTVTLFDGSRQIATVTLVRGIARFTVPFTPGTHQFRAVYGGDGQFAAGSGNLTIAEVGQPAVIQAFPPQSVLGTLSLQAVVRDGVGGAVRGAGVIFTAPSSGAGGSFLGASTITVITGADGIAAAPLFIPNEIVGSYQISAVVSGYPSVATVIPLANSR